MHELSLAEAIVEQVVDLSKKENFNHVLRIKIELGAWSGVDRESLEFCLTEMCDNTLLKDVVIEFFDVRLTVFCHFCQKERELADPILSCPVCHLATPEVVKGKDLKIIDLEVDSAPDQTEAHHV